MRPAPLVPVALLVALAIVPAPPAAAQAAAPGSERRWRLLAAVTLIADSNIDHTKEEQADIGVVPFAGFEYRSRTGGSRTELEYHVASHSYRKTDTWDRISHGLHGSWQARSSDTWRPETILDVSIKGTNEDRDLANRYALSQTLEYRLDSRQSITAYVTARVRDYDDPRRDSWNPYGGIEYAREYASGREWSAGWRYEENLAEDKRFSYIRWTYEAEYSEPVGAAGELEIELKYRPRRYWRIIEDEAGDEVTRRDVQWLAAAEWTQELSRHWRLSAAYEYERRTSNDPDRGFVAHLVAVALTYRW